LDKVPNMKTRRVAPAGPVVRGKRGPPCLGDGTYERAREQCGRNLEHYRRFGIKSASDSETAGRGVGAAHNKTKSGLDKKAPPKSVQRRGKGVRNAG
jgi:hypothetical protein